MSNSDVLKKVRAITSTTCFAATRMLLTIRRLLRQNNGVHSEDRFNIFVLRFSFLLEALVVFFFVVINQNE